jgi:hypothetical protein
LTGTIISSIILFQRQSKWQRDLARDAQQHQRELASEVQKHAATLADKTTMLQKLLAKQAQTHATGEAADERAFKGKYEDKKVALDQQRIDLEVEKLLMSTTGSSTENRAAALKLASDRRAEEARLIALFFDRLVGESVKERDLAFQAPSGFVEPELAKRLKLSLGMIENSAQREEEASEIESGTEAPTSEAPPNPQGWVYSKPGPGGFVVGHPPKDRRKRLQSQTARHNQSRSQFHFFTSSPSSTGRRRQTETARQSGMVARRQRWWVQDRPGADTGSVPAAAGEPSLAAER